MSQLPDIRAALRLEHKPVEVGGVALLLRRPTVADLAAVLDMNERDPRRANAALLCRHVLDAQGIAVWGSVEEAEQCPLHLAHGLVPLVEGLYAEGRD